MNNKRASAYKYDRISSEIRRVLEEVVEGEIVDKRVCGNVQVIDTVLSRDLSYCKVYVNVTVDDKKQVLEGLKDATGYIRHAVAETLNLRKIPDFNFVLDETVEKRKRIEELLEQIKVTSTFQ